MSVTDIIHEITEDKAPMRVFMTGATGWIGSAVVDELRAAGHGIAALARSDAAAASLRTRGVQVLRGDLDDLDSIRTGAEQADAVVHLGFRHEWGAVSSAAATERRVVATIGETLAGSGRPFLLASGFAGIRADRPALETDPSPAVGPDSLRGGAENLALAYVERDVRVVPVRFAPTVHGAGDGGFVVTLVALARRHGFVGYPAEGANRWAAVHRVDAAQLIARGLRHAPAGTRLHAVAEEGNSIREIAAAIGAAFDLSVRSVPRDAVAEHYGWISRFVTEEMAASSDATRALLGWEPSGPTLFADLASGAYGEAAVA